MNKKLDDDFKKAYEISSKTTKKLPPDIMLMLYAYYKQATKGNNFEQSNDQEQLRSAFKLNAWIQLGHLNEEDAKKGYIKLVNKYLK